MSNVTVIIEGGYSVTLHGLTAFTKWDAISNCIARECDCDADDVHVEEDEDGVEHLTVDGKRVARVEEYVGPHHVSWPVVRYSEAAE
jgi:hypothetical protein